MSEVTEKEFFDVTTVKKDDIIRYYNLDNKGKAFIGIGEVRGENLYVDGVQVYGEGWKQYVSKFFIYQVIREGKVIFQREDKPEE